MAKAGRGSEQVMIRLPDGMRDRIREASSRNGRSMNAEIVHALEIAFPEPVSIVDRLEELQHLFSALKKVRGVDVAVDKLTDEILSVIEAGANGLDPSLDNSEMKDLYLALVKWQGRRDVEAAVRKRIADENAKTSEDE